MESYNICNKLITIFGKSKGANDNKFNRAAKLALQFDRLESKFINHIANNSLTDSLSAKQSLACLMLLHTGIRVGNEDSAEGYMTNPHPNQPDKVSEFVQTYGLTTLKPEHFIIKDNIIDILFAGKKSVENTFTIAHPQIVATLKLLIAETLPDNYVFGTTDSELTKFIKANVGEQFSPKDFRCMRANILAWNYISTIPEILLTKSNYKGQLAGLFRYVSSMLNNTPGVCKKNYVAPLVVPYMESIFK